MTKLLALAGIAAMLAACVNLDGLAMDEQAQEDGATVAASLGYHGPAQRTAAKSRD